MAARLASYFVTSPDRLVNTEDSRRDQMGLACVSSLAFFCQREREDFGLHSLTGLEFDNVWIMGCEDGNLPHTDSTEEDEWRLLYVGMTRARHRLVLSSAIEEGGVSRFFEEAGLA